jgi:hypothetical protein
MLNNGRPEVPCSLVGEGADATPSLREKLILCV